MKVLFLESFFGGSHEDFALGFKAHSRHDVTLVTLPARFWKWRMRGAALYFVRQIKSFSGYDAVMATDLLDLTDLKALAGPEFPPVLLYFHENQLSYPLSRGEQRDFHLGFTNIVSACAADQVVFNSRFHQDAFARSADSLIRRMPDSEPSWIMDAVREKTRVIYPGCRFVPGPVDIGPEDPGPPLIIWNHRWEHDKNPEFFFKALLRLKENKIPFSLALLGENFNKVPDIFDQARRQFREEILVYGHVADRRDYLGWLKKGRVVISTAFQENFGISVVEAVRHGCLPLLPRRLSYPEIMPEYSHSRIFYHDLTDLTDRLSQVLLQGSRGLELRRRLAVDMEPFSWEIIVKQYDNLLEKL